MSEPQNGTKPKLTCHECGKIFKTFDPEKQPIADYNLTPDGPICRNRPECRGRQLSVAYEKRGLKRWTRRTQEKLLSIMDCPPKDWDKTKKWESVNDIYERVEAAIEFYSTCWPVCLLYAVQTDADGDPIREFGEWKRHTHRSLADVLAVNQSTVTRAILYLVLRNRVTEDEGGRLSPELAPKSLSGIERDACTRPALTDLKDLGALLPSVRKLLVQILAVAPPDACTRLHEIATETCTRVNRGISELRTQASEDIRDACQPHLSLLSRQVETETEKRASSSGTPPPTRPPAQRHPVEGLRQEAAKYLYEALPTLQAGYPDTPFASTRFSLGKADLQLVSNILDKLAPAEFDAERFLTFVRGRFKAGRSPNDQNGPRSLGLLIEWADDFRKEYPDILAREAKARAAIDRAEEWAREQRIAAEADATAAEARRQHLVEHPEDCEHCHGTGRLVWGDRKSEVTCNCPVGQRIFDEGQSSKGAST